MNRREFLGDLVLAGAALPLVKSDVRGAAGADLTQDWLARWEKNILGRALSRYCDKEMGEQLGWLIATNRDFMWNQQVTGAKFQRIDGGQPDPRWRNSPGVLWTALVPYDETLRRVFPKNHNASGWGGLSATPWFLALEGAGSTVAV